MIGSLGTDRVTGNAGEDILIGSPTAYDDDAATLRDLLGVWASPQPRATRISTLQDSAWVPRLLAGDTVLDDQAVDSVFGQSRTDWIFDCTWPALKAPAVVDRPLQPCGAPSCSPPVW